MQNSKYLVRGAYVCLASIVLFPATWVVADGAVIDKVYHPYVEPLEWELEWRVVYEDESPIIDVSQRQLHRLGLGHAVSESVFAELYLVGEKSSNSAFSLEAYEFEILWQLSEQGEYFLDYGLLFELEKERKKDIWEFSSALLLEKELGRYSVTANLGIIYEWGADIESEFESSLALQTRYRYSARFEPAFELYYGQNTLGLGPVFVGRERLGRMKGLRWEMGAIFGLDSDTADYTLRAVLEFEF